MSLIGMFEFGCIDGVVIRPEQGKAEGDGGGGTDRRTDGGEQGTFLELDDGGLSNGRRVQVSKGTHPEHTYPGL